MLGFDAIQLPSTIRLNQLTGLDALTVIATAPDTAVPEDGEMVSAAAIALVPKIKLRASAIVSGNHAERDSCAAGRLVLEVL